MDGFTVAALCRDWKDRFLRARIEKIHQPGQRDLVLLLRTREESVRILLSAHRMFPRAHVLYRDRPANPEEPPVFCMLLRRRLESGRIVDIRQPGWDRVIQLDVESTNEVGDLVRHLLMVEIMGKHSNILLCEADASGHPTRIVDSVVHVTRDLSRVRQVLPGLPYTPPPPQSKTAYNALTAADVAALQLTSVDDPKTRVRKLTGLVAGIGPYTAAEILHRANSLDPEVLCRTVQELCTAALTGEEPATNGLDDLGWPIAAAPFRLTSFQRWQETKNLDDALDLMYKDAFRRSQAAQQASDVERVVTAQLDRLQGKRTKLLEQWAESQDHDAWRTRGELLLAYAHTVEKGATEAALPNYYDEAQGELTVPLDPALSPIENAQTYFKQASKKKRALPLVEQALKETEQDMSYLEAVLAHLQDASPDVVESLRQELADQGFVERKPPAKHRKTVAAKPQPVDTFVCADGTRIRVGRNNIQNDRLTLRMAQPGDVWLHTKDLPGSHVVIACHPNSPSAQALQEGALLAAYFSKGRNSSHVPVDYTLVKHVWKPNGSRPGLVLYDHQKTLFVSPDLTVMSEILGRKDPLKP